jgi:lipopolysaccharide transport system permease protein
MRRDVIINLAKQDLFDRYAGSVFGGMWAIIRPFVNMLIFILIFSKVMGARLALAGLQQEEYSYSLYLVSGVLLWNLFAETVMRITNVFQDKSGLIRKVNVSLSQLPFYVLVTEGVIYWVSLGFFAGFLVWMRHPITAVWLWLPVIFVLILGLAYLVGFASAILSVFIRDIREILGLLLQIAFWLTPIVYVFDILPKFAQEVLAWNPIYKIISLHREVILFNRPPEFLTLMELAAGGMICIVLVLSGFRRLERDIRDMV